MGQMLLCKIAKCKRRLIKMEMQTGFCLLSSCEYNSSPGPLRTDHKFSPELNFNSRKYQTLLTAAIRWRQNICSFLNHIDHSHFLNKPPNPPPLRNIKLRNFEIGPVTFYSGRLPPAVTAKYSLTDTIYRLNKCLLFFLESMNCMSSAISQS